MTPTVRREDILRGPRGLYVRGKVTTAHQLMARLVIEEEQRRPASWVERIASAPSPFAVEGLVADFVLFGSRYASAKVRAQASPEPEVKPCGCRPWRFHLDPDPDPEKGDASR